MRLGVLNLMFIDIFVGHTLYCQIPPPPLPVSIDYKNGFQNKSDIYNALKVM